MTDTKAPGPKIEVLVSWDAKALETDAVTPRRGAAAVLMWVEAEAVDAGPSPALADALALALASWGEVAYRWRGARPAGARELGRASGRRGGWSIVAAQESQAVADLFETGWSEGDQTAAVAQTDARRLELLSLHDLRDVRLADTELLFSAIVDGAGAVLAASSSDRLEAAVRAVVASTDAAGLNRPTIQSRP